jgi:hypothetical protein
LRRAGAIHKARGDAASAEAAFRAALEHRLSAPGALFDYVEFLIEESRLEDAARALAFLVPETRALHRRREQLQLFLPSVSAPEPVTAIVSGGGSVRRKGAVRD